MLTHWGLTNFKSIYDADLPLAPLTVLTGTNSSGKSSLIQSILLVAQTLQNHLPERTLVLNGPLVELGSFEQIISYGGKNSDTMKIIIHLCPEDTKILAINYEVEFIPPRKNKQTESFSPIIKKTEFIIFEANDIDRIIGPFTFTAATNSSDKLVFINYSDSLIERIRSSLREMIKKDIFLPIITEKLLDAEYLKIFKDISKEIKEIFDNSSMKEDNTEIRDFFTKKISNFVKELPRDFISELLMNDLFKDMKKFPLKLVPNHFIIDKFIVPFVRPKTDGTEFTKKDDCDAFLSVEPLSSAAKLLSDYFTKSFKYLGPLRFHGNLSPFSKASDMKDVGISGEYAAAVYDLYKNEKIKYIPCQCFDNTESRELKDFPPSEGVFSKALNEWMRYLGIASSIDVLPIDDGYKIQIPHQYSENKVNLTHVGTGVSQVFPILVMGLLADENSTLVFEQEELHLHPAVQTRLADFFLSMAFLGKQCLVETHSEYFITQLRYRIANALLHNDKSIGENTKIYFSEKKGRESHFREIKVTKYGGISEWPDGFFDERKKIDDKMFDAMGVEFEGDDD